MPDREIEKRQIESSLTPTTAASTASVDSISTSETAVVIAKPTIETPGSTGPSNPAPSTPLGSPSASETSYAPNTAQPTTSSSPTSSKTETGLPSETSPKPSSSSLPSPSSISTGPVPSSQDPFNPNSSPPSTPDAAIPSQSTPGTVPSPPPTPDPSTSPLQTPDPGSSQSTNSNTIPTSSLESIPTVVLTPSSLITNSPTSPPVWSGSGNLLVGDCTTVQWVRIAEPTETYMPIYGCVNNRPNCCPYVINTTSTALGSDCVSRAYPLAELPQEATIPRCPADYSTISSTICCPKGFTLSDRALGRWTPCFSNYPNRITPPPFITSILIRDCSTTPTTHTTLLTSKPTTTPVTVVYALAFYIKSGDSQVSAGAKAGIGIGAGAAALFLIIVIIFLIWKSRRNKKDNVIRESVQSLGSPSTNPSDTSYTSPVVCSPSHSSTDHAFRRLRGLTPPSGYKEQNQFLQRYSHQDHFQASPQNSNMSPNFTPMNSSNFRVPNSEYLDPNLSGPTITEMPGVWAPQEMSADANSAGYELQDRPRAEMSDTSTHSGWHSLFPHGVYNRHEGRN